MKVLKFGGTSVGSSQNIQQVAKILSNAHESQIVVFSAMAGTTNALLYIICLVSDTQTKGVNENISTLEQQYMQTIGQLFNAKYLNQAKDIVSEEFENLRDLCASFSEGVYEVNIVISTSFALEIESVFKTEQQLSKLDQLASVTMRLPSSNVKKVGLYYSILKKLAWNKINIIEVISTTNEFTIIVGEKDIGKAFSVIKDLRA